VLPWVSLVVGALLVTAAAGGSVGVKTASFDAAGADRGSTANVTSDDTGAHTLDVAAEVHINATEPLVNVTNRLGQEVTVTVTLRDDSEHIGDLVVDGAIVRNSTSFTLTERETKTVEIEIPDDSTLDNETVYFHVNASSSTIEVTAPDRSTSVN
jgi:hypothetical protein